MKRLLSFLACVGCADIDYTQFDTGLVVEEVVCSHPNTQYEAQVDINFDLGLEEATGVEFVLEQYNEWWIIDLNEPTKNHSFWHARMQIYDFVCNESFYYDFVIED